MNEVKLNKQLIKKIVNDERALEIILSLAQTKKVGITQEFFNMNNKQIASVLLEYVDKIMDEIPDLAHSLKMQSKLINLSKYATPRFKYLLNKFVTYRYGMYRMSRRRENFLVAKDIQKNILKYSYVVKHVGKDIKEIQRELNLSKEDVISAFEYHTDDLCIFYKDMPLSISKKLNKIIQEVALNLKVSDFQTLYMVIQSNKKVAKRAAINGINSAELLREYSKKNWVRSGHEADSYMRALCDASSSENTQEDDVVIEKIISILKSLKNNGITIPCLAKMLGEEEYSTKINLLIKKTPLLKTKNKYVTLASSRQKHDTNIDITFKILRDKGQLTIDDIIGYAYREYGRIIKEASLRTSIHRNTRLHSVPQKGLGTKKTVISIKEDDAEHKNDEPSLFKLAEENIYFPRPMSVSDKRNIILSYKEESRQLDEFIRLSYKAINALKSLGISWPIVQLSMGTKRARKRRKILNSIKDIINETQLKDNYLATMQKEVIRHLITALYKAAIEMNTRPFFTEQRFSLFASDVSETQLQEYQELLPLKTRNEIILEQRKNKKNNSFFASTIEELIYKSEVLWNLTSVETISLPFCLTQGNSGSMNFHKDSSKVTSSSMTIKNPMTGKMKFRIYYYADGQLEQAKLNLSSLLPESSNAIDEPKAYILSLQEIEKKIELALKPLEKLGYSFTIAQLCELKQMINNKKLEVKKKFFEQLDRV